MCAAGVAGFLVIARPSGGGSTVSLPSVMPLAAGLAVAVAGCLALARLSPRVRPLALALACGINYGVAAFLVKLITSDFRGLPELLGSCDRCRRWRLKLVEGVVSSLGMDAPLRLAAPSALATMKLVSGAMSGRTKIEFVRGSAPSAA